jgi:exodeoxyribonuclease V alpha subunit
MQETLTGSIDRIVYLNEDNGFAVFLLKLSTSSTVTVKGYLSTCNPGEKVRVMGSWIVHPKFGKQFEATECTITLPTSLVGLKKYLSSGLIKGIGRVYAEKLILAFGKDVLEVIDKQPERLSQVPGIGPKRITTITTAWKEQKEIADIMVFLRDKQIGTACAAKIYKQYGKEALAILHENPYKLAQEVWGIGFKTADSIAQQMGIPSTSKKRITAALLHCITEIISKGHLYIEIEALKEKTISLLNISEPLQEIMRHSLHDLYDTQKIALLTHNNHHFVTLTRYYVAEKKSAQKLQQLQTNPSKIQIPSNQLYDCLRNITGMELTESQQQGILSCFENKVSIITGGPGTGKTTLIKQLIGIAEHYNLSYKLAAPTGRAAKRMHESTHRQALTIHRLLEFDVSTFSFVKNEHNAVTVDLLVIDEASMLDIFLTYAILRALPLDAHIVFIGDSDQLPSVGAGNVLHDMIASQTVSCTHLKTIFRQAQDSLIIMNAHRINQGEMPQSGTPQTKNDFLFIKEDDPAQAIKHIEACYKKLHKWGYTQSDSIVLVPMNRGIVGTYTLNHQLQGILNTQVTTEKCMQHGTLFKKGDRVMQIRNNYDKLTFNGDIGTITSINPIDQILTVLFMGRPVEYQFHECNELVLAYAITIHKSQGSEYPVVMVPLFTQHFTLLQRNLIYTAITRAKKMCIFIGQPKAIAIGVKTVKGGQRTTFLRDFLSSDLAAR